MKCTIPEISWHNREPVLSIDLHPMSDKFYRLATGGADCHVLIWQLNICDNGAVKVDALSDLTRHQRAINSVRWSATGQYLATADDDANIIVWHLKTDNIPLLEGETSDKEVWIVYKIMRGHKEDVYDLCWSPDGLKLLSGSVDNTAIIWDFTKGKSDNILTDHKGFVQGVSWDPKGHYIATISTDRVCRIFDSSGKQVRARIQKGYLPVPENHYLHNKEVKFFHDDTFKSFFRRLDFSPDGTLLAVPSGRVEVEDSKRILNATFLFAVDSWTGPVAILPTGKQCSTVARFCPLLFDLHEDGPDAAVSLPFRMILAVGTDHDVILYDTQQMAPFAFFHNIHYTRLTDLTWSNDGLLLMASSTDGFCAFITFDPNELGVQYVKEESEAEDNTLNISGCEVLEKDDNFNVSVEIEVPTKPRKPNLLEKWTIKTPKKGGKTNDQASTSANPEAGVKRKEFVSPAINILTPKRIKSIPVRDEPKNNSTVETVEPVAVKTNDCNKSGPLLNFFKTAITTSKGAKKIKTLEPKAAVFADEIEARDAWKCDKEETPPNISSSNEVILIEDSSESFCLHLEESCTSTAVTSNESQAKNGSNFAPKEICKESESKTVEDLEITQSKPIPKESLKENDSKTMETLEFEDSEKTAKREPVNENKSQVVQAEISVPDLSVAKVKKRVPLITLSSPKHKKK